MGKEKYLADVESLLSKSPVVNAASVSRLIRSKKKVKQYPKQLLRNLVLKGKVKRLLHGCYTVHDNPALAVFCLKPAYLGLQDALSFHELWEQETISIILTAKKIRPGIRTVLGMNVLLRRIDRKYLFGFDYHEQGGIYLPYSDIEKTFIDMIYFKEKLSEEARKSIMARIDKAKLSLYLKQYPERFRQRVLEYLKAR